MRIRLAAAAIAALALATPSAAHHGWARLSGCRILADRHRRERQSRRAARPDAGARRAGRSGTWCWRRRPGTSAPASPLAAVPRGTRVTARGHRHRDRRAAGDEDRAPDRRQPHLRSLSGTQLSALEAFALWLEGTPPALFLQESGWLYAGVNTLHVLGIALLVGAIVVLDLRLLGLWRTVPVAMLGPPAVAVASAGLALAVVSGAALFAVQATEYVANPFLYVKFARDPGRPRQRGGPSPRGRLDRRSLRPPARAWRGSSRCSPGWSR